MKRLGLAQNTSTEKDTQYGLNLQSLYEIVQTTARTRQGIYHDMGLGDCWKTILNNVWRQAIDEYPVHAMTPTYEVIDRIGFLFKEEEDRQVTIQEAHKKEYGM